MHGPIVGQVYTVDLDMKFPVSFVSFVEYGIPVFCFFFGTIRFTKGAVLFPFLFDRDVYTIQLRWQLVNKFGVVNMACI